MKHALFSERWRTLMVLLGVGLAVGAISFGAGLACGTRSASSRLSDQAMGSFFDKLAALLYLDQQQVSLARHTLQTSLDGDLFLIDRYGTSALDAREPGARAKLIARYAQMRNKYGPVDYPDNGTTNKKIDEILSNYRQQSR